MNILIVDDNANNRMILRLLLEDFEEENPDNIFKINEASNGQEAVDKCNENNFDIVLMDIIMPIMDGIEATKIIREAHPNLMIIAVSAVDDTVRQKMILSNGAEDYISKPVNSDIFISRISNYIKLINIRQNTQTNVKNNSRNKNIFTENIYSRYTTFILNSEDAISEFWEFFLLNSRSKYDNLSDVVRTIFSLAEAQVRMSVDCEVFIEESDDYQYFTITNMDKVPVKIIELMIKKNKLSCEYKIGKDRVSFELIKLCTAIEELEEEIKEVKPAVALYPVAEATPSFEKSKALDVFDYIDEEDLYELEEFTSKLNSLMLIVGSGDVTEEEIEEIYTYLEKIGSVIATYGEIYKISKALTMLSHDMANHVENFIKNSEDLGPMCKAFVSDMSTWIDMSFHTGAPSIDFMNDTIVVNCDTISSMLKMNE